MITRQLKLKINKVQQAELDQWLWHLTGVYNWAIRKIELDARDKKYHSQFDIQNMLSSHSKRMGIPSHVMQGTICQAYNSWQRCFKKVSGKPKLKGRRNKMNSIPFPDPFKSPQDNRIGVPYFGKLRYHKQELPEGKIKCGRIIKKASGWYLQLTIDTEHKFAVKETDEAVGIDPGFKTLLTLSNGNKIENPRELRKGESRIAQAQRANDKKLVAKLHEKQKNRRNDRNHKIARNLVEEYQTICYSDDNFKGMANRFGKSVSEASLGSLIAMITYKGRTGGRDIIAVNSKNTTLTCSTCGSKSGPTGLSGLAVRQWECACGAIHDRDINAAMNVLIAGVGATLKAA